jgi:ketosteroid isomerase-like protein
MGMMTRTLERQAGSIAENFVGLFEEAWAAPTVDGLLALLHADITYIQPQLPVVHGREKVGAHWRRIFALGPDLQVEVVDWAVSRDNVLYIEVDCTATVGGRSLTWPAVERCEFDDDGSVRRRILYGDSLPLLGALLRPRGLLAVAWWAIRIGRRAILARIRGQ